jgi:hypothetical protein
MLLHRSVKAAFNRSGEIYLLFDLKADPEERWNLAGSAEGAEMEREMKSIFQALRREEKKLP